MKDLQITILHLSRQSLKTQDQVKSQNPTKHRPAERKKCMEQSGQVSCLGAQSKARSKLHRDNLLLIETKKLNAKVRLCQVLSCKRSEGLYHQNWATRRSKSEEVSIETRFSTSPAKAYLDLAETATAQLSSTNKVGLAGFLSRRRWIWLSETCICR